MHTYVYNYQIEHCTPGSFCFPFTVGNKQYFDVDEDEYYLMVIEDEHERRVGSITVTPLTAITSRVEVYVDPGLGLVDHELFDWLTESILSKVEGEQIATVVDDYGNKSTLSLAGNYRELAQEFTFGANANDVYKFLIEQGRKTRLDFLGTLVLVERLDDKETLYSFLLLFVEHGQEGMLYGEPEVLLAEITLNQTKAGECVAKLYINPNPIIRAPISIEGMDCTEVILRFWREQIIDSWLARAETPAQGTESGAGRQAVLAQEISIEKIDLFEKVVEVSAGEVSDLVPLQVSEAGIKRMLREIIDEPFEQKDWGGETSDLFTTRVTFQGRRTPTAFLLKGPSVKGPLYIANLGKRGDQGHRLFREPASLYVIQHVDKIDSTVHDHIQLLARRKAKETGEFVYYCFIDGVDLARLLTAYGKIQ